MPGRFSRRRLRQYLRTYLPTTRDLERTLGK